MEVVNREYHSCEKCKSSNNLVVWEYVDGTKTWFCFTPGCDNHNFKRRPGDVEIEYFNDRVKPSDVGNLISVQTLGAYDVRIKDNSVQFILRDLDGHVVKSQVRNYDYPKDDRHNHFKLTGRTKEHLLFGKESARGTRCIITEGYWDALAAREMTGYTAVSVQSASTAVKDVLADVSFLDQFSHVYLCLDLDPEGRTATEEILDVYPTAIPVILPYVFENDIALKDSWDYLESGHQQEYVDAIREARPRVPKMLLSGDEVFSRVSEFLLNPNQNRGHPTGLPSLDEIMWGGFRDAETTYLLADPFRGKSTLARFFINSWVKSDKKVLYLSLEDRPERSAVRFMEMYYGRELVGVPGAIGPEELRDMCSLFLENKVILNEVGKIHDTASLETAVRYAVLQHGVRFVIIDHITILAMATEDAERIALNRFVKTIDRLKQQYMLHMLVISHNSRPSKSNKQEHDEVFNDTANDPVPTARDAYGSSAIEQMADNMLAIRRMRNGKIELYVLKCRLSGKVGKVFLTYRDSQYQDGGKIIFNGEKEKREVRTEPTDIPRRERQRLRETGVGELPESREDSPDSETPQTEDREENDLDTGFSIAKWTLPGGKGIPN